MLTVLLPAQRSVAGSGSPSCSDGIVDQGEDCDDGNVMDGDCCAADCRLPVGILAGPVVNPANNHRYYLLQSASWLASEAQGVCLGGHLVTINDEAENKWVWSEFSHFDSVNRNIWIGLTDAASEGTFVWTSGEPLTYTHWRFDQPDNFGGTENYVHLWLPDGFWNDYWGDQPSVNGAPANGVVEITDCGNGRIDAAEQCDDGNGDPSDGCTNWCTICGNGVVTPYEQCDDGNLTDHDGCSASCRLSACGDGRTDPGEECDDGNRTADDGCTDHCTLCGNGTVTHPEECDDGNTISIDGCSNSCTARWVLTGMLGGPQGEVRVMAIDPHAAQTLYAGFGGSGVYRSTDGGHIWSKADTGLPGPDPNALAVDPMGVVYAAFSTGVYMSSDGGSSWAAVNHGLPSTADARVLILDPSVPGTLYVGIDRYGVYKSGDAGQTWRPASSGLTAKAVRALAVAASRPRTLYVGTENGGVFRSTDGAQSWTMANQGLQDTAVLALAVDPANAAVVYTGTNGAVFKTANGGARWQPAINGLPEAAMNALVVSAETAHAVYAATEGDGVFQSTDGALTWYATNEGLSEGRVRALVIDPTAQQTLYAGTPSRFFKTEDVGANWQTLTAGDAIQVSATIIDPRMPTTVYAATTNYARTSGGVSKSTDGGATWALTRLPGLAVEDVKLDPVNPSILYAVLSDSERSHPQLVGVYRSTDAGLGWQRISTGLPSVWRFSSIQIVPAAPDTLYVGTVGAGVYKSTDGGGTWGAVNTGVTALDIWDLAIDWSAPGTVFAAGDGPLLRTTDGGASWSELTAVSTIVNALAADPVNPGVIYAAGSGGLYKTTDSGGTWSTGNNGWPVGYGVPAHGLSIDPNRATTLYLGVYFYTPALYRSNDGGHTWSAFADGLDVNSVRAAAVVPSNSGRIYVGTDVGVYNIELTPPPTAGDCNGNGEVSIDELITLVNVALVNAAATACTAGDANGDERITIDEIIRAVNKALSGSPSRTCGGIAGRACQSSEVCDLRDSTCSIVDLAGVCVLRPEACPEIFDPVCGCDAVTYSNECVRLSAGVTLAHEGGCG